MEELYTERYNLREKTNYTSIINREMYSLLLNVSNKYSINLVNEFPNYCSDFPNVICGVDASLLCKTLKFRIPDLHFDYSETSVVVPFIEDTAKTRVFRALYIIHIAFSRFTYSDV